MPQRITEQHLGARDSCVLLVDRESGAKCWLNTQRPEVAGRNDLRLDRLGLAVTGQGQRRCASDARHLPEQPGLHASTRALEAPEPPALALDTARPLLTAAVHDCH